MGQIPGMPTNIYTADNFGDGGNETTLNHVLDTHDLRADITIRDIMDPNGPTPCAEYVDGGCFNHTRGWKRAAVGEQSRLEHGKGENIEER